MAANADLMRELGGRLRAQAPRFAVTCARGTSDHAALYAKYLMELRLGVPVASVGPSIASIYGRALRLEDALCLTISQSGESRDLLMLQDMAAREGALTLALVNQVGSPAARAAAALVPLQAGVEEAVAATKTYVATLVAIASLVAAWGGDAELADGIARLPDCLHEAIGCDWSRALDPIAGARSVFTVSRGPGLTVAAEAALKFKETCRLHAEAYSSAELRHGPIALARRDFATLVFASRDETRPGILDATASLRATGAAVHLADPAGAEGDLPTVAAPHPLLDPICQAASFYVFVERLAGLMGLDPDRPENLSKVTVTL